MGALVDLEVASCGECPATDLALEGLVARVCSHVDLESRAAGKVLEAHSALVFREDGSLNVLNSEVSEEDRYLSRRGWLRLGPQVSHCLEGVVNG